MKTIQCNSTIIIFSLLIWFILISQSSYAQNGSIDRSNRPSFTIINLRLDEHNKHSITDLNPDSSYIARRAFLDLQFDIDRSDLNLIENQLYQNGVDLERGYNTNNINQAMQTYMSKNQLGQKIVSHLFNITDDFVWRTDLLEQRGIASQTVREAQQALASERGALGTASSKTLENLTRAYILVLLVDTEMDITEREMTSNGKKTVVRDTSYTSNSTTFLFKLDYDNVEQVEKSLGAYYCAEAPCDTKKASFYETEIPLKVVSIEKDIDKSIRQGPTMGSSLYDASYTQSLLRVSYEIATRDVDEIKIKSYVLNQRPITAMIGTKEGVERGRRYRAVRQTINDQNEIVNKYRGFVRGSVVTNNESNVTTIDVNSGKEAIIEFTPSSFKQVHGAKIKEGDVLIENPDRGFQINASTAFGDFNSYGAEISRRLPGTLGFYTSVFIDLNEADIESTKEFLFKEEITYGRNGEIASFINYGLQFKSDIYVGRGNLRLTPKIGVFRSDGSVESEGKEIKINNNLEDIVAGMKIGYDMSLQLADGFGVYLGLQHTLVNTNTFSYEIDGEKYNSDSHYKEYFSNYGSQVSVGFRINF